MDKQKFFSYVTIVSLIFANVLAIITIIQLIRIIVGGSWSAENTILALLSINVAISLSVFNFVTKINGKLERHLGWHRAIDPKLEKLINK